MRTATTIFPTKSTALRAGLLASTAFMSPVERAMGRFMRAPVDHGGDGGSGDGGSSEGDAGAGDAGAGDAGAGDGDAGTGDGGDAGDGDDDGSGGTALGDGADDDADGDAGDDDGSGDGEGDASEGAPETYDLTTEGIELDPEMVGEAEPILRELNLTNDQAKKFVPIAAKMVDRAVEATVNDIVAKGNAQRKEWLDSAKAADDIGGAKWDATMHMAAKGLDALGFVKADKDRNVEAHPFRLVLESTGFGNNPDMIRMAAKLGELVSEDGDFVRADASAPGAKGDVAKRLYPND